MHHVCVRETHDAGAIKDRRDPFYHASLCGHRLTLSRQAARRAMTRGGRVDFVALDQDRHADILRSYVGINVPVGQGQGPGPEASAGTIESYRKPCEPVYIWESLLSRCSIAENSSTNSSKMRLNSTKFHSAGSTETASHKAWPQPSE